MTWKGKVTGGVVVLDDPKGLPDGTVVSVEPVADSAPEPQEKDLQKLSDKLMRLAGTVKGLPKDMARNHDHYLHGHPKK